jgi:hypothetical protein
MEVGRCGAKWWPAPAEGAIAQTDKSATTARPDECAAFMINSYHAMRVMESAIHDLYKACAAPAGLPDSECASPKSPTIHGDTCVPRAAFALPAG